jgi:glycosyltransferase involved in cell wall biosynthesis
MIKGNPLEGETVSKKRLLVFIVAYNAEKTIQSVLRRLDPSLAEHDTHILIIDDSSSDQTFERAREFSGVPFPMTVLFNPVNQGYGGNQKIGFHYAIREKFDIVALVHGDGQYAPECLGDLIQPLLNAEADAVFGSRMMERGDALRGGMPLYKFVGNKILTGIQNRLLKTSLSEFHSGYRVYSVDALARIPFDRNTNDFHFDTEIIIQLVRGGYAIRELPIPTYYGDEICHVNGLRYAWDVVKATLLSRAQDLGILYNRKYDVRAAGDANPLYQAKFSFQSPHTMALERVVAGSRVLDIGCASGYMARALRQKGCDITGIDQFPPAPDAGLTAFYRADLNAGSMPVDTAEFDYVLLLDVIEHMQSPEAVADSLRSVRPSGEAPMLIVSTGNVAFLVTRLMLLFGQFHYGPRGILDLTHTRLFTFATLRELFEQAGFRIEEVRGVPAPFPLALGDNWLSHLLVRINLGLIRLWKGLFSYQILMVVRPLPVLESLLERAIETSRSRAEAGSAARG